MNMTGRGTSGQLADRIANWVAIAVWLFDGLTATLLIFGNSGGCSVALDGDHIPFALSQVFPEVYGGLARYAPRFLHRPVYYVAGAICICLATFTTRWLVAVVSKLEKDAHIDSK